jgi:biotin transport system substrate-specific component
MHSAAPATTLSQALWPAKDTDAARWLRAAILVTLGVAAMAIAAKVRIPMWPVPITMQTFVVLTIGAAFGAGLGMTTMIAYLAIGALGADIFTSSSAENNGIAYMMGGSGGYLLGFVLAAGVLGWLARQGWDRTIPMMALAMLIGSVLIYVPGLVWLNMQSYAQGWSWTIANGLTPFLIGDALKLALAALVMPALWTLSQK